MPCPAVSESAETDPRPPVSSLQALGHLLNEGLLLFRADGQLVHANAVAQALCGSHAPAIGDLGLDRLLSADAKAEARARGFWEGVLSLEDGREFVLRATWCNEEGEHYVLTVQDHVGYGQELQQRRTELEQAHLHLTATQEKLLQSEKMASIGQLAAGVAHEINNPIGYVHSNLGSLQEYLRSLFSLIEAYERALRSPEPKDMIAEIDGLRQRLDIDFISQDLPQLMAESREGIERVTRIVRDLKDFSRSDRDEPWKLADLHAGLESTLNIIWNELKYKATLEKSYGTLPLVQCLPSELNQVFMNLLLNAGHAIGERGVISIASGSADGEAWIEIGDTGPGIPQELLQRIFDPFFTTKPAGKGTGLGLSISYSIVAKHHGRIDVDSRPDEGSRFRIVLPVRQPVES